MSAFTYLLNLTGLRKQWPQLSEEEVRVHNNRYSLWIICENSVYDVTSMLHTHPGGEAALLRRGGGLQDCAVDYAFHSRYARSEWEQRKVGEIAANEREKLFFLTLSSSDATNRQKDDNRQLCDSKTESVDNYRTYTAELSSSVSTAPRYQAHHPQCHQCSYERRPAVKQ